MGSGEKDDDCICHVCFEEKPLYYLCDCKTLGRCEPCVRLMYNNKVMKCPTCDSKYRYKFELVEEINWRAVGKKYCDYFLRVILAAATIFSMVGFSYDERHAKRMDSMVKNFPWAVAFSVGIGGLGNLFYFIFWLVIIENSFRYDNSKEDMSVFEHQKIYACFVVISQMLAVIIVSVSNDEFMFNVFTYIIGTSIVTAIIALIWLCGCVGTNCKRHVKNDYIITKGKLVVTNDV